MDVLIYFSKSMAVLTIFYLVYFFLLRKDTLFAAKRYFFIFGIIAAILLPFAEITTIVEMEAPIVSSITDFDAFELIPETNTIATVEKKEKPINWWQISLIVYLSVMGFFLSQFIIRLFSLKSLLSKHTSKKIGAFKYVAIDDKISPFSIFNFIVYNPEQHNEKELEMILKHEEVHARQWHSLDIILGQLITTLQWINPFSWAYKKGMEENLEYIADSETVEQLASKKAYQYALVNASSPITVPALTSPFYQSLIKKRIVMLNKNTSHKRNVLKASLVLPVLAIFLYSFNVKEEISYITIAEAEIAKTEFTILPTSTDADIDELEHYFSTEISKASIKISNLKRDENGLIQSFDFKTQFEGQEQFYTRFSQTNSKTTPTNTYKGHTINYADAAINVSEIGPKATSIKITAEQLEFVNTEFVLANKKKTNLIISAEISESQLNAIEAQLENESDAFEIDFKDRKRNAEGKLIELSIDTKFKNQTRFIKNATYNSGKNNSGIASLLLNVANDELQFGNTDGSLLNKVTPNGVVGLTFPKKEKDLITGEKMGENPLYIINGKEYFKTELPQNTNFEVSESIEILQPTTAIAKYGQKAKDGAFIFKGITTFVKDEPQTLIETPRKIHEIIPNNSTATESINFKIRETQALDSVKNNKPLYIVNGEEIVYELGDIDPNNIASIDILKGENATNRFGVKGQNGVMMITLKNVENFRNDKQKKGLFERFKNSQNGLKNQPLFIVDGIEMDQVSITKSLSPDDIESITVLNEKHQIEKYGEKGKNGVVLIILKKK